MANSTSPTRLLIFSSDVFMGFVDFGVRMLLAPTDNSIGKLGLKLKIDLGCIANGGDVKSIIKSNDLVIPTFKFGIQKDL